MYLLRSEFFRAVFLVSFLFAGYGGGMNFAKVPRAGEFYYHAKHDPTDFFSYLYVVVGLSLDTEEENLEVVYVPLYETDQELFNRDLEIFMGEKDGRPRFVQVTDPNKLQKIYDSGRATKWTGVFGR